MDQLMPFDEINRVSNDVVSFMQEPPALRKQLKGDLIDEILELLILSYMLGNEAANDMLAAAIPISTDDMSRSINKAIDGKTWRDRVDAYIDGGNAAEIIRVIETASHRIYNEGIYDAGISFRQQVWKVWETMMDDRVRDTHQYLQGEKIPLDREYYTYDGDSALYPGGFSLAENNVNCRCRIRLSR